MCYFATVALIDRSNIQFKQLLILSLGLITVCQLGSDNTFDVIVWLVRVFWWNVQRKYVKLNVCLIRLVYICVCMLVWDDNQGVYLVLPGFYEQSESLSPPGGPPASWASSHHRPKSVGKEDTPDTRTHIHTLTHTLCGVIHILHTYKHNHAQTYTHILYSWIRCCF